MERYGRNDLVYIEWWKPEQGLSGNQNLHVGRIIGAVESLIEIANDASFN